MDPRVLSIQSHVVSGYVGHKSATFPLQLLGFEVDAINSVHFSNHTGYKGGAHGQVMDAAQLEEVYQGLKVNDLLHYTHISTGYIGCDSFLLKVRDVIKEVKEKNPGIAYSCDPVMGDRGFLYVPKELLPIYQEHIIPLADICTPNQYEAELLTGMTITDEQSAKEAMMKLHEMGVKTVVLSSTDFGPEDKLIALATTNINGKSESFKIVMHKFPANFTGTGDLFAALLLAWLHTHTNNLKLACEKTISTMQHILRQTLERAQKLAGPGNKPSHGQRELKLIQCKNDIENPEIIVTAEPF